MLARVLFCHGTLEHRGDALAMNRMNGDEIDVEHEPRDRRDHGQVVENNAPHKRSRRQGAFAEPHNQSSNGEHLGKKFPIDNRRFRAYTFIV